MSDTAAHTLITALRTAVLQLAADGDHDVDAVGEALAWLDGAPVPRPRQCDFEIVVERSDVDLPACPFVARLLTVPAHFAKAEDVLVEVAL